MVEEACKNFGGEGGGGGGGEGCAKLLMRTSNLIGAALPMVLKQYHNLFRMVFWETNALWNLSEWNTHSVKEGPECSLQAFMKPFSET